jgi:release factor glutamine methyltransferase
LTSGLTLEKPPSMQYLKPGGWLLLEHGYDQGEVVPALLRERGFGAVSDYRDAAGIRRTRGGCWPA